MVDIHCHILYGVDDGSDDLAETVEMLRLAERGGTVKVIATPHSNVPGSYRNYWCAELESRLALINSELKREGVGIEVYPGQEIFTTTETAGLLREGKLITLNSSRYALVEFDFYEYSVEAYAMIGQIKAEGYVPIVAHPERYAFVCEEDDAAMRLKDLGCLLVGQDRRPGQGRQRSDSMILCSYNPENNQLSMISFLRDLYVQIPGYSDNRLNSAYVFGGFPLLKETLYLNFGVTVDGCFEVDFNGFTGVIDTIGGVDISLSEAEAAIVGGGATAGMNHLNGEQALTYARIRYIDSDFNRTARQRNVINSAIGKLRNCSVKQLMSLLDTVLPLITTDMSNMDITSLALRYAPSLPSIQVSSHYVPGEGCYQYAKIRGMSVLVPDLKKVRTALREQYLPF